MMARPSEKREAADKPFDLGGWITNDLHFGYRRDADGRWGFDIKVSESALMASLLAALIFGAGFVWHAWGPSLGGLLQ